MQCFDAALGAGAFFTCSFDMVGISLVRLFQKEASTEYVFNFTWRTAKLSSIITTGECIMRNPRGEGMSTISNKNGFDPKYTCYFSTVSDYVSYNRSSYHPLYLFYSTVLRSNLLIKDRYIVLVAFYVVQIIWKLATFPIYLLCNSQQIQLARK